MDDIKEVFYANPYSLNNKPLILKQWSLQFNVTKEFLTEIHLWIKLSKLLMNCWSCDSLRRIASAIGIPMFADKCTANQTRISYAYMLIEVDGTKPLPSTIGVMDASRNIFNNQWSTHDWRVNSVKLA